MLKKIQGQKLLIFSMVCYMLLIIARDVLMVSISDDILLFLSIALMAILNVDNLISFMFFLFPFTCGIPGYIMLAAFILLIIKNKSISRAQFVPVLLIFILEIINQFNVICENYTAFFSFMSFSAIFFFFLNKRYDTFHLLEQSLIYYVIGCCFVFSVIYYNMIVQASVSDLFMGLMRNGALGALDNDFDFRKGHLVMNANTIAYFALSCICVSSSLIKYSNKKITLSLLFIFSLLCGFLTFSRTFLVCILMVVPYLIFVLKNSFKSVSGIILITLLIVLIVVSLNNITLITTGFETRLNEENIETAGGRTILFSLYNDLWSNSEKYILFGCGVIDYGKILEIKGSMHSGIQQIYVCLGVIGLLLFIQQIGHFLRKYLNRDNWWLVIPFIITLIFDQSVQFLNPYPLMLPILVSLLVCHLKNNRIEGKEQSLMQLV